MTVTHEGNVLRVAEQVDALLTEASLLFKPGVKLTFLARLPGEPDADFVLTTDDPLDAAEALQRRAAFGKTGTVEA